MTIPERLKLARLALNADLSVVAEQAGIAVEQLAALEAGTRFPENGDLQALADVLAMEVSFFTQEDPVVDVIPASPHAGILNNGDLEVLLAQTRLWLEMTLDVEAFFDAEDLPPYQLPERFPADVGSPLEAMLAAEHLREFWRLGDIALPNLLDVLEDHGVIVGVASLQCDFLAAAFFTDDLFARPVIMVQEGLTGEVSRKAVAKELGYLAMNEPSDSLAATFARAFLMPASAIRRDMGSARTQIDLEELVRLKHKYGFSMLQILERANELDVIEQALFEEWRRGYSPSEWNEIVEQ